MSHNVDWSGFQSQFRDRDGNTEEKFSPEFSDFDESQLVRGHESVEIGTENIRAEGLHNHSNGGTLVKQKLSKDQIDFWHRVAIEADSISPDLSLSIGQNSTDIAKSLGVKVRGGYDTDTAYEERTGEPVAVVPPNFSLHKYYSTIAERSANYVLEKHLEDGAFSNSKNDLLVSLRSRFLIPALKLQKYIEMPDVHDISSLAKKIGATEEDIYAAFGRYDLSF